jgi:hypothetical protein
VPPVSAAAIDGPGRSLAAQNHGSIESIPLNAQVSAKTPNATPVR